ncbi:MAG: hydrogenase iron-sulfur subunit [Rhodospirillales bacterium]|nr:hydrogenase iron-sulfur subunit [Rhodospirillales bacterium]
MLNRLRSPLQIAFLRSEKFFDRFFGPEWNPMRQLGTVAFYFFWIAAATGIIIYIFFETSVNGAYRSVEYMSNDQWYFAGVMRSLHRYSSDGMVLMMALHLIREWSFDRYRGVRWYAWFTGVPVIWLLYASGLSGYWLVWDELAQYVALGSMEWFDALGIFGEPVANNFLSQGSMTDRFFTLLVFIHIFVPLFLLFAMWIHVIRVSQPKINPPRGVAIGLSAMLVVLSLIKPAISHGPADLSMISQELNLDWFFMLFYPVFDAWGGLALWALAIGGSLFLAVLPWLPPVKLPAAPVVALDHCNGCGRCYADCPYGAITMMPRTDGLPYSQQAEVNAANCTRCGICVGACPVASPFRSVEELVTGIDLPHLDIKRMRTLVDEAMAKAPGGVVVVGCEHGPKVQDLTLQGAAAVRLPCVSMLPPSFIDYMVDQGAGGVMIAGCPECGCRFRYGVAWMQDRLDGRRDPYLRKRVPRERVRTFWASHIEAEELQAAAVSFQDDLKALNTEEAKDV